MLNESAGWIPQGPTAALLCRHSLAQVDLSDSVRAFADRARQPDEAAARRAYACSSRKRPR